MGVRVTSPTFVISRIHPSLVRGPALVEVDAYRLGSLELVDLDLDLDADLEASVTVIQWGAGQAERTARLVAVGARWERLLDSLAG